MKFDDDRAGGATQIGLKHFIMSFAATAWLHGRAGCHMSGASSASSWGTLNVGEKIRSNEVKTMNARSNSARSVNGYGDIRGDATAV